MPILTNTQSISPQLQAWVKEKQVEIHQHPAWHGALTQQEAESLLKNQAPYTYLLRSTADPKQFYLSFIQPDLTSDHRFFVMQNETLGWFYQNANPHEAGLLQDLIPEIMHCSKEECSPLIRQL